MHRILFVDDEPGVLAGLRRMLRSRRQAWDMQFLDSPVAALDFMGREPVDVIVSDFRMPGLDGGQLLAEVRRRHPDAARLILSGQTAEEDMIRVVTIAHQFLSKPAGPDQLIAAVDRALHLRRELSGDRVRAEMAGIDALPSPPSALHDLLEALERPEADVRGVAEILQRHAVLSAAVLERVNRLFFTGRPRVPSLEIALARVGVQTIRSLALMDEIVRAFPAADRLSREWLTLLQFHALETALLARRLAPPEARDNAFCAGLLHECGQLVFAVCRPDVFAAHLRLRDREARLLVEIEQETFGVTHAQAGAYLLSRWGFPADIVEAAARHTDSVGLGMPAPLGVPGAVRLAHWLVESERFRVCSPSGSRGINDTSLDRAGVLYEAWAWRAEQALAGTA